MSDYVPRLVHLPGTVLTPEVVLHRTLNKTACIKAVVVVIQWDDDTYDVDWSQQRVSELCMASMTFTDKVLPVMRGQDADAIFKS